MSNPYLSQIERGLRKPSAEVLQQLASALRVSTPAMYLRAGLLDSEGSQGVLAAIAVDPELTIGQKQSLSQIYETFRNENVRVRSEAADAPAGDSGSSQPPAVLDEEQLVDVAVAEQAMAEQILAEQAVAEQAVAEQAVAEQILAERALAEHMLTDQVLSESAPAGTAEGQATRPRAARRKPAAAKTANPKAASPQTADPKAANP